MNEIELKLQLDAASAERLEAPNVLSEKWRTVQKRALYFDTSDRALTKAGLSLSIRQSGSHRTQTIKMSGSSAAGLFARSQWEMSVNTDVPVLTPRNEALRASKYLGRVLWQRWIGYHRRSRVETKMQGVKLLGQRLAARDFDRQVAEFQVRVAVLNGFTALGIPVTKVVG